jgi:hypothetical protein
LPQIHKSGCLPLKLAPLAVLTVLPALLLDCGSPTAPDSRQGFIALRIVCDGSATSPLVCRAETYCTGLYRCPDPAADGADATQRATWSSEDPTIVRVIRPGVVEAVASGDTVLVADLSGVGGPARRAVSVFPGTAPLPTSEIFGSVWEAGKTVATGALSGATVRVMNGIVAGRTATVGVPPALLPGYFGPFGGPGYYRILGVPAEAYQLQVSASGYVTEQRPVTVTTLGSSLADFQLRPQATVGGN